MKFACSSWNCRYMKTSCQTNIRKFPFFPALFGPLVHVGLKVEFQSSFLTLKTTTLISFGWLMRLLVKKVTNEHRNSTLKSTRMKSPLREKVEKIWTSVQTLCWWRKCDVIESSRKANTRPWGEIERPHAGRSYGLDNASIQLGNRKSIYGIISFRCLLGLRAKSLCNVHKQTAEVCGLMTYWM